MEISPASRKKTLRHSTRRHSNHIEQGKAAEAEKLFQFLMMLDHHEMKFWMGLGVSQQLQQKYDLANKAYTYVFTNDYENCVAPLRSAECLMHLGQYDHANGAAIAAEAAAQRNAEKYASELAAARMIQQQIANLIPTEQETSA